MAKILSPTKENLALCKEALGKSGVIAVPTETVYGLAGNALDENSLRSIFKIKGRPLFNPLIIHSDSLSKAENYATFNSFARELAKHFWPGPLTMVLTKKAIIPDLVTANLNSVGVRCPKNPAFLDLLKILPYPLAAPSANPFGYISPTSAEHVIYSLGDKLEYVLDGGNCKIGIESTIIDLRDQTKPKLLRPGPISKEAIEAIISTKIEKAPASLQNDLPAPGMLKSHYSPITPLEIRSYNKLKKIAESCDKIGIAYIFIKRPKILPYQGSNNVYWLSENGEEFEIARNLYRILRSLDNLNYTKIYIEAIDKDCGINVALKDRLSRASSEEV